MLLGWPLTILLVMAIVAIVVLYARADRDYQKRKLDIVQKRLAALEEKKLEEEGAARDDRETEESPAGPDNAEHEDKPP